jgi:hypothetical protein
MRIVLILSHVRQTLLILARMVISCTVEYKQLTIPTVYRIGKLGLNPVHDTSKPNLHLNCKVLGLVRANTMNWISIVNLTSELMDDCSLERSHS